MKLFFVVCCFVLMLAGCSKSDSPNSVKAASPTPQPAPPQPTTAEPLLAGDPAPLPHVDGARAMQYAKEVVAFGSRAVGTPGHAKVEAYLRAKLKGDGLEEDTFSAGTPAGRLPMRNFIAKFPGSKPGVIVVSGHYDTLYTNRQFVGANDAGSSTALLLALADQLRGKKRNGYSVWLVFFDGEEAIKEWTDTDSLYGSRHLATKWTNDGTVKKIKALFNVDMIGDRELNIDRDLNSSPVLLDLLQQAAAKYGYQSYFYRRAIPIEDDHMPFARAGVPVADIIDFDYGYNNAFWHTNEDTIDKLSPKSFEIVGSTVLEAIAMMDAK